MAQDSGDPIKSLARALTFLAVAGSFALGSFAICASSMPFVGLDGFTFLFFLALPVGLVWAISMMLGAVSGYRRPTLVAPLILAAATAVSLSGLPLVTRVALSDADLTEVVRAIEAGNLVIADYDEYEPLFWAGAVPIHGMEEVPGGTYLVAGFTGSDTPAGLVRFEAGPPVGKPPVANGLYFAPSYQHVYGNWYRWYY